MPNEAKMFVIVCKEHLSGAGPYGDPRAAMQAAIEATESSKEGCLYQPILISLVNGSTMKKVETTTYDGGQYL